MCVADDGDIDNERAGGSGDVAADEHGARCGRELRISVEQSIEVEPLEPGRRRTLVFDPVPVETGVTYDVAATLMVLHPDFNLDDNQISVVFTVNEADSES